MLIHNKSEHIARVIICHNCDEGVKVTFTLQQGEEKYVDPEIQHLIINAYGMTELCTQGIRFDIICGEKQYYKILNFIDIVVITDNDVYFRRQWLEDINSKIQEWKDAFWKWFGY